MRVTPNQWKPTMTNLPVYVLARTPGATNTVEWTSICRTKSNFIIVRHDPSRTLSRWVSAERKNPFAVCFRSTRSIGWSDISHHKTLEAAMKAAKRAAHVYANP